MKTFLNVLYRKILYKIPLKFLLLILVIIGVLYYNYSSADNVSSLITNLKSESVVVNAHSSYQVYDINGNNGTYCIKVNSMSSSSSNFNFNFGYGNSANYYANNYFAIWSDWNSNAPIYVCLYSNNRYYFLLNDSDYNSTINYEFFKLNTLLSTNLPSMTSLECQTEYSLIPVSSVDQNYCTTNNLCPSQDCPVCPVGSGSISNVYINDILHVGAPFIYMNIPDEIDWDYAYTQGGTNMNIDVVGYNQDTEKINGIITIQNYKPDGADLSTLVSDIIPLFVPGLCIILLLYFIFRFIKKIF